MVFEIAQFFSSINHQLLPLILNKASFDSKVFSFFSNYLISRKTQYQWNDFISSLFHIDIGIGQGSVLFSILSALYLSPIFQEKSFEKSNTFLFCSYNIILFLLKYFGLVLEYRKSEVFHFFRSYSYFNPLFLNLSHLRGPVLHPKDDWRYLGFIFYRKLSF